MNRNARKEKRKWNIQHGREYSCEDPLCDLFRVQAINSVTPLKSHHHLSLFLSLSISLNLSQKWLSRPSMSPTSLPSTSSRRMPLSPSAPPASPTVHLFFHRKMLVVVSLLAEIFEPRPLFPLLLPFCNEIRCFF